MNDWMIGIGFALGTLGVLIYGWRRQMRERRRQNIVKTLGGL